MSDTAEVITAVATGLGCPYARFAEQAIQADELLQQYRPKGGFIDEEAELAYIQTAEEADNNATNLAAALLACETCNGDPNTVDLTGKVCAFALEACLGSVGVPVDIRQYQESRPDFGN